MPCTALYLKKPRSSFFPMLDIHLALFFYKIKAAWWWGQSQADQLQTVVSGLLQGLQQDEHKMY